MHGQALRVPEHVFRSSASWCFDIVEPTDTHTACFTRCAVFWLQAQGCPRMSISFTHRAYGRFIRGTGSVLYQRAILDQQHTETRTDGSTHTLTETETNIAQSSTTTHCEEDWRSQYENRLRFTCPLMQLHMSNSNVSMQQVLISSRAATNLWFPYFLSLPG
jgi:hypothetical protein